MSSLGIWKAAGGSPVRLQMSGVALESHLEQWIEDDPSMVESGLSIVGRQLHIPSGGIVDLLGVDVQGRIVVIEVKRGSANRIHLAQALEYAATVSEMAPAELRRRVEEHASARGREVDLDLLGDSDADSNLVNVRAIVASVGQHAALEPVATYLGRFGVPLSVVSYEVFGLDENSQLLVRQISDDELLEPAKVAPDVDLLLNASSDSTVREIAKLLHDAATDLDFGLKTFKHSIMYTPPTNRTYTLFTVWVAGLDGKLKTYVATSAFAKFFPDVGVSAEEFVGPEGWRLMDIDDAMQFSDGMSRLLSQSGDS